MAFLFITLLYIFGVFLLICLFIFRSNKNIKLVVGLLLLICLFMIVKYHYNQLRILNKFHNTLMIEQFTYDIFQSKSADYIKSMNINVDEFKIEFFEPHLIKINLNGLLFRDTILQYSLTSQPVLKTCHFKRVTYLDGKWACNIEVKSDNCILVTVPNEKNKTSEFVEFIF